MRDIAEFGEVAYADLLSPPYNISTADHIQVNNSLDAERVLNALSEMEDLYSWDL